MVVALYSILPFVVFFNIATLDINVDVGVGLALGLASNTVAAVTAYLLGSRVFKLDRPAIGALIVVALVANTGYLGYPLNAALLGADRLGEVVAYDVAVSGPSLLLGAFAVGAAFGDKAGETVSERVWAFFTRNPPLIAAVAALVAPDALAPEFLVDASRVLVIALLPLGFFVVGATLAEESHTGHWRPRLPSPPVISAIGLRMMLVPALLFAASAPLIDLPSAYQLQAAMPCGINSVLVAHIYGLNLRLVAQAVAWSTVLAVVATLVAEPLL